MLTKACEVKWYPEIVVSFHYILTSFTLRGPSSEKLSHSGVTGPASVHSKDYRLVALPQRQEMESASWSHLPDAWLVSESWPSSPDCSPDPPRQGGQAQETRWCEVRQETRCNLEPTGLSLSSWPPQTLFILRYIQVQWTLEESWKLGGGGSLQGPMAGGISSHRYKRGNSSSPSLRGWQDVFTATAHMWHEPVTPEIGLHSQTFSSFL